MAPLYKPYSCAMNLFAQSNGEVCTHAEAGVKDCVPQTPIVCGIGR